MKSAIHWPTSRVPYAAPPSTCISGVRTLLSSDASTALRTSAPSSASPKCSSNIAAESICATGLARFLPAACGHEPCTGSKSGVCSPSELDGCNPIEPVMHDVSSVSMSPKVFSVTITSKNVGSVSTRIEALSMNM